MEKIVVVFVPSPRRPDVADADVVTVDEFRNKMLPRGRTRRIAALAYILRGAEPPTEVDDRLLASVQKLAGGNGAGGRRTK